MTKAQFMATLRLKLSVLPPEECNELMEDYELHFAFGLQNGKTEEEIVAELGDPEELAKEALGSRYVPEQPIYWFNPETPNDEHVPAPPLDQSAQSFQQQQQQEREAQKIQQAKQAQQQAQHARQQAQHARQQAQQTQFNHSPTTNTTPRKSRKTSFLLGITLILVGILVISYYGFGFGFGIMNNKDASTSSYTQRWNFDLTNQPLQGLNIDTDFDIDVQYTTTNKTEGYVEVSGKIPQYLIDNLEATKIGGNFLDLNLNSANKWQWFSFNFGDDEDKIKIVVALNQDQALNEFTVNADSSEIQVQKMISRKVNVTTSSGDIEADNITADQLALTSSSGSLSANQILAKEITISTNSGDLNLENTTGNVTSQSSSGEMKLEQVKGNIDLSSSSGDILVEQLTGDGKIQSSSGEVILDAQRSDSLSISTSSGDVSLSKDNAFQGIYKLSTSSGDILAPDSPAVTADTITIETSSGDIIFN